MLCSHTEENNKNYKMLYEKRTEIVYLIYDGYRTGSILFDCSSDKSYFKDFWSTN